MEGAVSQMEEQPKLEKTYLVMNVQVGAREIVEGKPTGKYLINLQLFDESSSQQPGVVKGVTFAMHEDEYKALGKPTPPSKVKVTITPQP